MSPNELWWGRCEPAAALAVRRAQVACATADALGVDVADVEVVEFAEPQGVRLRAFWTPS